jgi:flagellar hook-associated protein 3 FlgL
MIRVADSMRYQEATRHIAQVRSQHARASQQALTGRRLTAPSDDPGAAAQLVKVRSNAARLDSQRGNIRNVRGDVELSESTLAEAGTLMQQIRELAMQGASDQTSAEGRQLLADQVSGLRDQLLGLANTRGTSGYLFAGSQVSTQPFDSAGTFVADDAAHLVDVGSAGALRVNASGENAFTAVGGRDIFADLDALVGALATDDGAGVRTQLDNLDAGHEQLQTERGRVGLLMNRLDTSDAALSQAEVVAARQDEQLGAADPIQAYSDFVTLGQALERSIAVAQSLLNLTAFQ